MFERGLGRVFVRAARHPVITLALLVALLVGSGAVARHLHFADILESFFAGTSTEWTYYKELTGLFVTDHVIAVGFEPPVEIFSSETLQVLRAVSRELESLDHVESVNDLTSVDYFEEGQETFSSEPLVPDPIPTDREALSRIRRRALEEPLYLGGIVSRDGRVAAIHVRIVSGTTSAERTKLVAAVERVVGAHMTARRDWRVAITGDPVIAYYNQAYMERDLGVLVPAAMVLLFVIMVLVFRRIVGPLLALVGGLLFVVVSTALLVLTGGTMNNCTTMVPPFAFIISITVAIHFTHELRINFLRYGDRAEALKHTLQELTAPVVYANFSTALGFFSLATSNIPAIYEFGVAMGLGMIAIVFVLLAYYAAIGRLVPTTLLASLDPKATEQSLTSVRLFERLGEHVLAHRWAWLGATALASVVTLYGATRIRIETNTIEMFHESDQLYQDAMYYGDRFGGVSTLYIAVDGASPGALKDPAVLADMEKIERFLTSDIGAGYTYSLVKFVKTMQRAFFGGDAARYSIPESEAAVSQLLLINGDDDVDDVVNQSHSRGVIVAWINEHSSEKLLSMKGRIEQFLAGMPQQRVRYRLSGTLMLDTQLFDDVARSTLQSFLLAMAVIFVLRLIQFRDLYLGAISLLPNAFPIWTTFGVMGLVGIPLNIATAMAATVTLGIADDETIHFFAGYQSKRKQGLPSRVAIMETLKEKGSSLFLSTVIVGVGFSTLLLSNYGPTMWFGIVLTLSFVLSIFANVVFAPALLSLARPAAAKSASVATPDTSAA